MNRHKANDWGVLKGSNRRKHAFPNPHQAPMFVLSPCSFTWLFYFLSPFSPLPPPYSSFPRPPSLSMERSPYICLVSTSNTSTSWPLRVPTPPFTPNFTPPSNPFWILVLLKKFGKGTVYLELLTTTISCLERRRPFLPRRWPAAGQDSSSSSLSPPQFLTSNSIYTQ